MPLRAKFSMVFAAKTSLPTRVTMSTSEPSRAAATAWLAPLPPQPIAKSGASRVSPSWGIRRM